MTSETRKPRSDAAANHQLLLGAARELFAQQGASATMDDLARAAGVGVGTVYRHFPNKHVLLDGLFDDRLSAFLEFAEDALNDTDPWHGFSSTMTRLAWDLVEIRGLHDLVLGQDDQSSPKPPEGLQRTMAALLVRGQDAGVIQKDLTTNDLMTIQAMVDAAAERDPDNWHRFLEILLEGTRQN